MAGKVRTKINDYTETVMSGVQDWLDNIKIYKKFLIILLVCVVMPIGLSIIVMTSLTNNYVSKREMMSFENASNTMQTTIRNVFEEAVRITNSVSSDNDILNIAEMKFENEREYYNDNYYKVRSYSEKYITEREYIKAVSAYLYNDTISNGGIIWHIDSVVQNEKWYKQSTESENIVTVCVNSKPEVIKDISRTGQVKPAVSVIRRISRGSTFGELLGFVKVDLNMDRIASIMKKTNEGVEFYLVNEAENVFFNPQIKDFEYGDINFKDGKIKSMVLEKDFGNISYMSDWKLISIYDNTDSLVNQIKTVTTIVFLNLCVGLFMMFILFLIYRSFSRRMNVMMNSMREAENDEFKIIQMNTGADEIGELVNTYNHMASKINKLINDVYKLDIRNKTIEAEKAKAELNFLQSQVNPHFIFNVLNAMLVVSVKNGYSDLSEQISCLAKMFRRLLDWSEEYEPLSTEIVFVETYLKLEKFRFGELFQYKIDTDDEAGKCRIPKMIIQPLVENACKHGLQGIVKTRMLNVRAKLDDKNILTIKVCDNGKGIEAEKLKEIMEGLADEDFGGHIGLKNVYKRLKIYYGDDAQINISSIVDEGTEIIIRINYNEVMK